MAGKLVKQNDANMLKFISNLTQKILLQSDFFKGKLSPKIDM